MLKIITLETGMPTLSLGGDGKSHCQLNILVRNGEKIDYLVIQIDGDGEDYRFRMERSENYIADFWVKSSMEMLPCPSTNNIVQILSRNTVFSSYLAFISQRVIGKIFQNIKHVLFGQNCITMILAKAMSFLFYFIVRIILVCTKPQTFNIYAQSNITMMKNIWCLWRYFSPIDHPSGAMCQYHIPIKTDTTVWYAASTEKDASNPYVVFFPIFSSLFSYVSFKFNNIRFKNTNPIGYAYQLIHTSIIPQRKLSVNSIRTFIETRGGC